MCTGFVVETSGKIPLGSPSYRRKDLAVSLYTWKNISHLLYLVNQGAGKFSFTAHTNRFRTAAAAAAAAR